VTPERWEQIGNIYDEASLLTADERVAFIDRACAGDDDLRREVESLLAAENSLGNFIAEPALKDVAGLMTAEVPGALVGKRLGHYQVISFIGAGGMGEVYSATDPRLGRRVAIKLLPAAVSRDADRLHRFEQEARAVGMLNHPNILTIHDIGEYEGAPYIVSELLEGETLRERMKDGPIAASRAVEIALQIARGLAAAHERGIVHRDLKPENVFINTDGRVKILDFGLAKLRPTRFGDADDNGQAFQVVRTNPGMMMGTVSYMAPEQLRGAEADHRADIFAFGVILYEMLAGERPFRGDSAAETMSAILKAETPQLPPQIGAQSLELERVIRRCLEKKEQQRFQSMSDLGFALEALTLSGIRPYPTASQSSGAVENMPTLTLHSSEKRQKGQKSRTRIGPLGWVGWALAGIFMIATVVLTIAYSRRPTFSTRIVPFTSFPGQKSNPVFSPDGNQIAFYWDGVSGNEPGIYVKLIDAGTPLQLVSLKNIGGEANLAWSPDGRSVAFNRRGSGIFTVPALGGPERKLTDMTGGFSWSPDGKTLAIVSRDGPENPLAIYLFSLETGATRQLTTSPDGSYGDRFPAWSPDGRTIAFIRSPNFLVSDVHLIPATGGEPKRLTFDNLNLPGGLAWSADGREIIYSSPRGGLPSLWRIASSGGHLRRLIGIGEYAYDPAVARAGDRLAYVYRRLDLNIWLAPGPNSNAVDKAAVRLIASSREETSPNFSPDGKKIAFVSDRSGSKEIWVSTSDGQNAVQLTNFGGSHTGTPRWSPDGRQIVFDSRPEGQADIYAVSVDGGRPQRVTTENSEDVMPSWSRDGRWIYFGSRRGGNWQIWKTPAEGGAAVQVTGNGGFEAFESVDGKLVYYVRQNSEGIWRMPAQGGDESRVFEHGSRGFWALLEHGVCVIDHSATPTPAIEFYNFSTRQTTLLRRLEKTGGQFGPPGLSVSADGQRILYWQVDQVDNDIMLIENFR
jgi:Tol biopolymer transport system component